MAVLRWKDHIPEILTELRRRPTGPLVYWDFQGIFLGVTRRRAFQLMHEFGAVRDPDGRLTVDRDSLQAQLEEMQRSGVGALTEERRAALEQKLEPYRKLRAAPYADFPVPAGRAAYGCRFSELPASIRIGPSVFEGETVTLLIGASGLEDLLAKLFLVSQAAINDLDQLNAAVERAGVRTKAAAA